MLDGREQIRRLARFWVGRQPPCLLADPDEPDDLEMAGLELPPGPGVAGLTVGSRGLDFGMSAELLEVVAVGLDGHRPRHDE